jgi:hypothetical protein
MLRLSIHFAFTAGASTLLSAKLAIVINESERTSFNSILVDPECKPGPEFSDLTTLKIYCLSGEAVLLKIVVLLEHPFTIKEIMQHKKMA